MENIELEKIQNKKGIKYMDKRLRYEKVNGSNDVIVIDLCNGYSVVAVTGDNKDIDAYVTSLFLKDNTIDTIRLIGAAHKLVFPKTDKSVNSAILKMVSENLEAGFFQYYIDQYEFEENLVDEGITRLEGADC